MSVDKGLSPSAVRERQKWLNLCRGHFKYVDGHDDYAPELEILNERLNLIADDMEAVRPQRTARAECAIWSAMFRDIMVFPHPEEPGVETAINMLYGIAASMERFVESDSIAVAATPFLQRLGRNRALFGSIGPWRHYRWQVGALKKKKKRHGA